MTLILWIKKQSALAGGSVNWVPACETKGHWFNSWSGHMPWLWARSPAECTPEATTHWCFSPSFSPSLPLCLKINKYNLFLKKAIIIYDICAEKSIHTKKNFKWLPPESITVREWIRKIHLVFYVAFYLNLYNETVFICYWCETYISLNIPEKQNNPRVRSTYSQDGCTLKSCDLGFPVWQ